MTPLLDVRDLTVSVSVSKRERVHIVEGVSFVVERGEALGLVGESGSGKTMTSLAIMGLLPEAARIEAGSIRLDGEELVGKSREQMRRLRGSRVSMIMQDATSALDPSFTVESQLAEPLRLHRGMHGKALHEEVGRSLEQVRLTATAERRRQYPHQLSGGMRQRVTSAIALAGRPGLLIADEPTTALDVTTQVEYLRLLKSLQRETGVGLLFIAHDLLIVRHLCQQIAVMYAREVVEQGPPDLLFSAPAHPYTRALVDAIPTLGDVSDLKPIPGQAPGVGDVLAPCHFAPRCEFARDVCREERPPMWSDGLTRRCRCWGSAPDGGWISEAELRLDR